LECGGLFLRRRFYSATLDAIVMMRDGILLAAIGIVFGLVLAYMAARAMGALLVGIRPENPLTIVATVALCFVTVLAGCVRPAIQAARVDPMIALRVE
jgi:ABC-type antimicrobial peptide transport system permease subunit